VLGVVGVTADRLVDGFGPAAAGVLRVVPRRRAHGAEEELAVGLLGDELVEEVARAPVEDDPAHIEDDGIDGTFG